MIINITDKYIKLPVSNASAKTALILSENGAPVYSLEAKPDFDAPAYYAYINVSRFKGRRLEINLDVKPEQVPEIPTDYNERLRPQVHFTTKRGWLNDPNGLIYHNGIYHMFYQHNPAGTEWGNMHWGHAVSRDLLHWEEKDIALYPDALGTMFSGSAIQNPSDGSLMLFYTAAGSPFTQCMARSYDGGETFEKYAGNPVVPHIVGTNRDPKVVWCDELEQYVMALYLDGSDYALLTSHNLTDWSMLQTLALAPDNECPDFYPLLCDGERKWIFSGASDFYYVGRVAGGKFVPEQEARRLHDGSSKNYAAQTFSGIDGRTVRVSWNRAGIAGMPFNMQMSFPVELTLSKDDGGYALRAKPVSEIKALYTTMKTDAAHIIGKDFEAITDRAGCEIFTDGGRSYTMLAQNTLPAEYAGKIVETHYLESVWRK